LALANVDAVRGRLDYDKQVAIKNTVDELIQNITPHSEAGALPVTARSATIICLAGRGPLNVAATLLLEVALKEAQIYPQLVLSSAEFVKMDCSKLPGDGETIVCLSLLDNNPAHARFLSRRVLQKLPRAHIVLGCWSLSSSDPEASTVAGATGFDVVTSSSDAVQYIRQHIDAAALPQKKMARSEPVA
jgi:hypothetical protein